MLRRNSKKLELKFICPIGTQPPPAECDVINIDDEQSTSGKNEREKPAQEKCRKEIDNWNAP